MSTTIIKLAIAGPGYAATSPSSVTIGTGTITFATQANLAFLPGPGLVIASPVSNPAFYVMGTVVSYTQSGGSGTLVLNIPATAGSTNGSGTFNSWNINLTGDAGYSPQWIVASGVPGGGTGNNDDMYLNSATADVYGPKAAGSWGSIVCNIKGATGPQGIGFNPRGAWASGVTYAQGDLVSFSGTAYISLISGNIGNTPSGSPSDWQSYTVGGALLIPSGIGLVKCTNITTGATADAVANADFMAPVAGSGVLAVVSGVPGIANLTANAVLVGAGASGVNAVGVGTTGQVLTSNGPGVDPSMQTPTVGSNVGTIITCAVSANYQLNSGQTSYTADTGTNINLYGAVGTGTCVVAGTMKNLFLHYMGTQPSGGSFVVTFYKNGSPTSLTVSVGAGAGPVTVSDTSHTVSLSPSDTYSFQLVNNGSGSTPFAGFTLQAQFA